MFFVMRTSIGGFRTLDTIMRTCLCASVRVVSLSVQEFEWCVHKNTPSVHNAEVNLVYG